MYKIKLCEIETFADYDSWFHDIIHIINHIINFFLLRTNTTS
jgi:hypothetical protein